MASSIATDCMRAARPDHRPWLFTRSGWAGVQRYAWTWTGDVEATWTMLRRTLATVLNLGLSGIPYTGPDIGGFRGSPSPELYVRWFQLATFLPFFRTHSAIDSPAREPWTAARDHLDVIAKCLHLRYRMLPYLYSLAQQAALTGWPLVRPMWWPDQTDPYLQATADAFLLGDALVVAPVLDEGAEKRELTLPPGRWLDFGSDRPVEGRIEIDAPLTHIPVFVRAGSVIPTDDPDGPALHLYGRPERGLVTSTVYADDGEGYGPSRTDEYVVGPQGDGVRVERRSTGTYRRDRDLTIELHGLEGDEIVADGIAVSAASPRFTLPPFGVLTIGG